MHMGRLHEAYFDGTKSLSVIVDNTNFSVPDDTKRTTSLLEWVARKSALVAMERQDLIVPNTAIPKKVHFLRFSKLKPDDQTFINQFYVPNHDNTEYLLNAPALTDPQDAEKIVRLLVFSRGNVVWTEFGFNIGCEFGGRHPALILKNNGETLLVIPLSSQEPLVKKPYHVKIEKVYNYEDKTRWASVTNLRPISVYRVDLSAQIGSVKGKVLDDIQKALKDELKI